MDNPITNNECMFCNHRSESLVDNVKHMSVAHSFFIPDADYLVDMEGLLVYLADKIAKGKFQLRSVQQKYFYFSSNVKISFAFGVTIGVEHFIHWMQYANI